jgi:uncharacterized membrane protein YdcZ (DUF606 family)
MLVSVGICVVIGEITGTRLTTDTRALYAISFISISLVGAVLVVRKTMVLQSEDELKTKPGDPIVLKRWQTGYIVTYVLCELLGLFGLLLRLMGSPLNQVWPYYAGTFVMLLLFWPRLPQPPPSNR